MSEFTGTRQIEESIVANASTATIWSILVDAARLPEWVPAVDQVQQCDLAERPGAERRCAVHLNGKPGTMVERCVAMVEQRSISYLVVDESFGMARLFDGYGFRISLQPRTSHACSITIETFYSPRHLLSAWANAMVVRRQLRAVVRELIAGLADLAERDEANSIATAAD